jgi:hypothetical protein
MKNLKVVFVLLFGLLQNSFAQQPRDYKGHIIDSKGGIYNHGVKVGVVSKEGLIKDAKGNKIAFMNANGTVSDANGNNLGHWGKDGKTYYDANGAIAFTVDDIDGETCNILDAKGKKIGNVHDSYKGVACALHCTQKDMDMKNHSKVKQ